MKRRVFKDMGHGQTLNEHPDKYADRLVCFLDEDKRLEEQQGE